jgi:hypothetical protein
MEAVEVNTVLVMDRQEAQVEAVVALELLD